MSLKLNLWTNYFETPLYYENDHMEHPIKIHQDLVFLVPFVKAQQILPRL